MALIVDSSVEFFVWWQIEDGQAENKTKKKTIDKKSTKIPNRINDGTSNALCAYNMVWLVYGAIIYKLFNQIKWSTN